MSVLKIKNEQGVWEQINTIKGDTGPVGPQGPAGPAGTTDYNDLINAPTNVSHFTNDSGYLTLSTLPIYQGGVE